MDNIYGIIFLVVWVFIAFKFGGVLSKFKIPSVLAALIIGFIASYHFLGHFIPVYGVFAKSAHDSLVYKLATGFGMIGIGIYMGISFKKEMFKKSAKQIIGMPILSNIIVILVVTLVFHFLFRASWMLSILLGSMSSAAIPAYPIASIKEFKPSGDVASNAVPMASIDMAVGFLVFMAIASISLGYYSLVSAPLYFVFIMFIASGIFGIILGFIIKLVTKNMNKTLTAVAFMVILLVSIFITQFVNTALHYNFLLEPIYALAMGIYFANATKDIESTKKLTVAIMPLLWVLLVVNLFIIGANINLILLVDLKGLLLAGAILFLVARIVSKYLSYFVSGKILKAPKTVSDNMGIALLGYCANGAFFVFYLNKMLTEAHGNPIVYHQMHLVQLATVIVISAGIINDLIAVPINPFAFRKEVLPTQKNSK